MTRELLTVTSAVLLSAGALCGQVLVPEGPDFQLNTSTTYSQYVPAIAGTAAPDGSFVAVWSSFSTDQFDDSANVLDGCHVNGRYWVFAAATTNVEYTLRVEDRQRRVVREYHNPLGTAAAALTDTAAFATCP